MAIFLLDSYSNAIHSNTLINCLVIFNILTVMEASESEEDIFRVKIEASEEEDLNYNVKIEQNQFIEQGTFPRQTKLPQTELLNYELILSAIRRLNDMMGEIPTNSDKMNVESYYKEMKIRYSINYAHEIILKEAGTQSIITLKTQEQSCENFNSELDQSVCKSMNEVLSAEDMENCAAYLLNYYKLKRIFYTPNELEAAITEETLSAFLKVRNWKRIDIKDNLRDIARELQRLQIYFIRQIHKSEQQGRREELEAHFEKQFAYLRDSFKNENRQIDQLFPNEREVIIKKLVYFNRLPAILKTSDREKYLEPFTFIASLKTEKALFKAEEIQK